MIRTVNTDDIVKNIKEMCIEANHYLSKDMDKALKEATASEKSELGKKILNQLQENLKIADEEMIPICQDTGMAVIFLEVGQDVHFEGMAIEDAVNEGVRQGYTEGYLRKSVVGDPIIRENTKDNTPAVIHYSIVPGNKVKITLAPKGFGSENMSRVFMLKPADGIEGVKNAILTAVKDTVQQGLTFCEGDSAGAFKRRDQKAGISGKQGAAHGGAGTEEAADDAGSAVRSEHAGESVFIGTYGRRKPKLRCGRPCVPHEVRRGNGKSHRARRQRF